MGRHSAIDFRTIPPTINLNDSNKNNILAITSTSICDRKGNVIFYSNGIRVFNKNGHVMPNGSNFNAGLISNSYASSGSYYPPVKGAIIIPFPNDTNKFYMFYVNLEYSFGGDFVPSKLYYLIVDITLNGGLGDVVSKDNIIINDTLKVGALMAVKHSNGNNWWILDGKYKSDKHYSVLVDSSGVNSPITQYLGNPFIDSQMVTYSPNQTIDGEHLAYLFEGLNTPGQIDLFDFDRCSGLLSNYRKIKMYNSQDTFWLKSCCYSPNNRYLYVSDMDKLWQMDLQSSNPLSSMIQVGTRNPYSQLFLMKNSPNGKIYIAHYGGYETISLIQHPDSFGTACNFLLDTVHFGSPSLGPWADGGLPNNPNFALGAINCNVGMENVATENNGLNIYPNPTNSNFTVASDNSTIKSITIYDIVGREIVYESLNKKSTLISLAGYSSGLYFIKVVNENGEVFTKKIVKE